ncbi:MAG: formylmethanofuran--tetrahydromethanopterin N-formyltransferase [Betaproteobacteria bacterium]
MIVNGVVIDDTFAEAFGMRATRLLITALNLTWARHAAVSLTGFATSVIGCGCEAGIERELTAEETPDGRPGLAVLLFAVSAKELARQVERRVAQCVLTAPSTAVFSGLDGEPINLARNLRYFGDGFQMSKIIGGKRYWRVPVMDGEFVGEESAGMINAVGGGNFLVLARGQSEALRACEAAIEAMSKVHGVIMPFPGGVVRSGSKIGSKYKALSASTNDAFCPTLRGAVASELNPETGAVLEIVIDGLSDVNVRQAMRAGIDAVCGVGAAAGVQRISAGNYGGKLGAFQFRLHDLMQ